MRFRPCIDLHDGKVKQIVGGTLRDVPGGGSAPATNFVAELPPAHYADLYWRDGLEGGHVIMLGPGNEAAATEALSAHPGLLQVGGGISPLNAHDWLAKGAAKVIVTSYIFDSDGLSFQRLRELSRAVPPERLVLDLSCRRVQNLYHVAYNRWQSVCPSPLGPDTFRQLAEFCSEFLVHAVDVEGLQRGIDPVLAELLALDCPLPVTYAGGARSMEDVLLLERLGQGRVDVTVGSALDLFGGTGIAYRELVEFDRQRHQP